MTFRYMVSCKNELCNDDLSFYVRTNVFYVVVFWYMILCKNDLT